MFNDLLLCYIFQLIKRQFSIGSQVNGAAVGAPVQAAAIVSLDLARHIHDKLPIQNKRTIWNWRLG